VGVEEEQKIFVESAQATFKNRGGEGSKANAESKKKVR